jgi:hypothetical protein
MALLLLQDCLIDLKNFDKSISIKLNESLVKNILTNGAFNESDSIELLKTVKDFLTKHDYHSNTIFLSPVFFNIPFFEENLRGNSNLEIRTVYEFVKEENMNSVEILEIGNHFFYQTSFDFKNNKQKIIKRHPFNLDSEIYNLVVNEVREQYKFSDLETIKKINNPDLTATYVEYSELEYSTMKGLFSCFVTEFSVVEYYNKLRKFIQELSNDNVFILNQLSLMHLFQHKNIVKLSERKVLPKKEDNKNSFLVELLPFDINFESERKINIWLDGKVTKIKIYNNGLYGELMINPADDDPIKMGNVKLNPNQLLFKVDSLKNLSCEINNLNDNNILSKKIYFN